MPGASAILGKYRLVAELGRGGMADVFLAVEAANVVSAPLVIKRLKPELCEDAEFIAMFLDEARLAVRLHHPNIVETYEIGCDDPYYFLTMELLYGQPWSRVLRRTRSGAAEISRTLRLHVLCEVLAGLHYAHTLKDSDGRPMNVVHRDVTPHNVFLTYDGRVKLVDFGIAKAAGRSVETAAGIIKGKVKYMAPEQATGNEVDSRADLFSVGVMLWEALTDHRMWGADTEIDVLRRLLTGDLPPLPGIVRRDVPEALDRICARALAPRPEDRYPTAAALRNDLVAYVDSDKVAAGGAMSTLLTGLFQSDRERFASVVETRLNELRQQATGEATSSAFADLSRGGSGSMPSLASQVSVSTSLRGHAPSVTGPTAGGRVGSPSTEPPGVSASSPGRSTRSARKKRSPWLAVSAMVVSAAAIAVAATQHFVLQREPSSSTSLTAAEAPSSAPTSSSSVGEKPPQVTVTFLAKPAQARIWIDGVEASTNPHWQTFAMDHATHEIRATSAGQEAQVVQRSFDADSACFLDLQARRTSCTPRIRW